MRITLSAATSLITGNALKYLVIRSMLLITSVISGIVMTHATCHRIIAGFMDWLKGRTTVTLC